MLINPFWNVFTMCLILMFFLMVTIFFLMISNERESGPQQMLLPPADKGPGRNTSVTSLVILPIWSRTFHHCCVSQSSMINWRKN